MKILRLTLLTLLVLSLTMVAVAQSDDTSADINACYTGGSLEGKCDWPTDAEDDWAWTCGWYIARYENASITLGQIPTWCNYFVTITSGPTEPGSTCYYSATSSLPEFTLDGPLNTLNNVTFYVNDDGTCATPLGGLGTVVQAADAVAALATCEAVYGTTVVDIDHLIDDYQYVNVPNTWYACFEYTPSG